MSGTSTPNDLLTALLPEWQRLLQAWSASGALTAAAQEALVLKAEPEPLKRLVSQWSQGDFSGLPPIVLLPANSMPGAAGAYATSTGTIYLNQDWLATASATQAIAVLTEELGHHLDGALNTTDTPGDEGEIFSSTLFTKSTDLPTLQKQNDHGFIALDGQLTDVEFANAQAKSIQPGSTYIASLGTNGRVPGYSLLGYYYALQTIVGTSAAGEYLATPYSLSLAEKYTTPAGFDLWTVWEDASKTGYISLIGLNIEQISFNGTYIASNGGISDAIPRFLTRYTSSYLASTWGFKGGASNEIFIGQGSLSLDSGSAASWNSSWRGYSNLFVVAGDAGTDSLFIPLIKANHLKLERNSLGLSSIRYTDTNSQESQYILSGVEFIDYIDARYTPTNPRSYNLVDGTQYSSVFQASSTSYGGTSSTGSTNGTPGDDLILVANKGYNYYFYTSFNGFAGTDVLLFDNWTRANLTDITRLSSTQWRLTFGGTVIIADNIEYLQFQDVAVSLNSDGTTTNIAWQPDLGPPTYAITPSASITSEGSTFTTNIQTTNVSAGTTFYWTLIGTGITAADFSSGALTGSGAVGTDGKFIFSHTITNDQTKEGDETLQISLFTDPAQTIQVGSSATVLIKDTSNSLPASFTVTPSSASIDEGSILITKVQTSNLPANTTLYWSLSDSGITQNDFSQGALAGIGNVGTDGSFTFSHSIANDQATEGPESIDIRLFSDPQRTQQVGNAAKVVINDTSKASLSASFGYSLVSANFQAGGLLNGLLPDGLNVSGLSFANSKLDFSTYQGLYVTASQLFAQPDGTYSTAPLFSPNGIGGGEWGSSRWGYEAIDNFVLGTGFGTGMRKSIDLSSLDRAYQNGSQSVHPTALAIQIYNAKQNPDFTYSPQFEIRNTTTSEVQKRSANLLGTIIVSAGTNAIDSAFLLSRLIANGISIPNNGSVASDFLRNSLRSLMKNPAPSARIG